MNGNKKISKSKLFKLKEWLTVPEAAKHMSTLFSEEVCEADVLRLVLDGHLKLSVNFVNTVSAKPGKIVSHGDPEWKEFPDWIFTFKAPIPLVLDKAKNGCCVAFDSLNHNGKRFVTPVDPVNRGISGIWDLPMIGNEAVTIEHKYHQLTGGPAVKTIYIDGAFVEGKKGEIWQLQQKIEGQLEWEGPDGKKKVESFDEVFNRYHPACDLPEDSVLVVRTSALRELEQHFCEEQHERKQGLGSKERESLLKIIIGIAMEQYGYDPNANKNSAPQQIVDDLAASGLSLDVDTVRKYLKEASEIIPRE